MFLQIEDVSSQQGQIRLSYVFRNKLKNHKHTVGYSLLGN